MNSIMEELYLQHRVCAQVSTGWWKPVAVANEVRTWANSNALVYKQAWHPKLAHRILRGPRVSGLQESL